MDPGRQTQIRSAAHERRVANFFHAPFSLRSEKQLLVNHQSELRSDNMAIALPDFLANFRRIRPGAIVPDDSDEQQQQDALNAAPPVNAQVDAQTDAQQSPSWQQVALSSFGSQPLPIFNGQPSINEFASPDVQRLVGQQADSQQGVAPQSTSTPPDDSSPAALDKSTVPVSDRQDAIFAAGGLRSGITTPASSAPSTSAATASMPPASSYIVHDKHGRPTGISPDTPPAARLDAEQALAQAIQIYQPHKQSILKSIALNAARGFAAGGPGGAIVGAVTGATPQGRLLSDQNWKRVALSGVYQNLKAQSDEQMKQAKLNHLNAETQALNARGSQDGQTARTRSQALGEAARRLRMMGGTYQPGKDAQLDAIVQQYGLAPKQRGAGGFNSQNIKVVGNQMVYVENVDGKPTPVVIYSNDELTPQERTRNAIALESVNAQRARNGQAALMISEDADAPGQATAQPPTSQAQPGAQSAGPPGAGQTTPPPATTAAPVTAPQTRAPVLTPVPGAKPPVMNNGRHRQRSYSRAASGGQKSDQIGASLEARDAARYSQEAVNARAQAAAARARGEDDVAASWEQAARTADENARKVGSRRGSRQSTPQPKKNDPLGILD
jgi:hypothetical protein